MTSSRSSEILIRGDEAARARPVELGGRSLLGSLHPVGPWAGEVDEIRERARHEGYDAGFAEGRSAGHELGLQQGTEQAERRNNQMAAAVDSMISQFERRADDFGPRLATESVELALQIAAAILDQELSVAADPGADVIARCLELTPSTGDLVARLHPDDAARLGDVLGLADRQLTVVADVSLRCGDAVITIDDTMIDARLAQALERVGEALR